MATPDDMKRAADGLTDEERADLRRRLVARRDLLRQEARLLAMEWDIVVTAIDSIDGVPTPRPYRRGISGRRRFLRPRRNGL